MAKICMDCKQEKDLDSYYVHGQGKYKGAYRHNRCIPCYNKRKSERRALVVAKDPSYYSKAWRRLALKSKYRMSEEDYLALLKAQDYRCAICGQHQNTFPSKNGMQTLCVDHCHESNKIRGLLCRSCNSSIGLLKHDKQILEKAIVYLNG